MPITEANSGYLKQQGVVRVHGSLIVKLQISATKSPQEGQEAGRSSQKVQKLSYR